MAIALTLMLLLAWTLLGSAVFLAGGFRWSLRTLLFAPTAGYAVLIIPTYILVRFGVPVRLTAVPIVAVLFTLAALVLWKERPAARRAAGLWRQGRVFVAVLALSLGLTAWPMVGYGFDWIANGNDDMANYCLAATAYRDHAFAAVPTLDDYLTGRDGTRAFWSFYILLQVRAGSEVLLALVATCAGISAQQVFMPTLVALHLALLAATSGLTLIAVGRRAAAIAGALFAVSGLASYALVQQLIGQVSGMALMCASLALVTARFGHLPRGLFLRRACVCGVLFSAQIIYYPEIIPLLVGACVFIGLRDLAFRRGVGRYVGYAAAGVAVMAALTPAYLYSSVCYLWAQSGNGGNTEALVHMFPFYLTPRALALLWGLLPFVGRESELYQNAAIVLGLGLTALVLAPAVRGFLRRQAFAAVLGVAAVLTAWLYTQRAAFGLFKIAMFAQPFIWALIGAWAVARRRRWERLAAAALLLLIAALNAHVQFWYVDQSRGKEYRVELPAVTGRHALAQFRTAYSQRKAAGGVDRVLLATENNVLLKLMAAEVRDAAVGEVGIAPLGGQVAGGFRLDIMAKAPWLTFHGEWRQPLLQMREEFIDYQAKNCPALRDPETGRPLHKLIYPVAHVRPDRPGRVLVATGGGSLSILNRTQFPEDGPPVICAPLSELSNVAVFCDATGARQHYLGLDEPENIALYQLEQDPTFRKRTMAGVGRSMVIDVLNPAPRVRVLMSYTGSCCGGPDGHAVAPVQIVGERKIPLNACGFGAARLVSAPVAPQALVGGHYLALEFGQTSRNSNHLSSLEKLWGAEIPRDRRRLTCHARDISVLTEEQYAGFRPPQALSKFPDDLLHPHIEYSGFYEEGWAEASAKVRLSQTEPDQECVIRGQIPGLPGGEGFRTELAVLVDGVPAERRTLKPGDFEVRLPGGRGTGPRWVELRFSQTQLLPAPDGRRVTARICSIGFEPRNEALSRPPEKLAALPGDLSHPKLEHDGIYPDGWCGRTFRARLWQSAPGAEAVIRGAVPAVPPNDGAFRTELTVLIDGQEVARRSLAPGEFEVRAPAGKTTQARWIECRFTHTQTLPPAGGRSDGRSVGAHLRFLGFEPPRPAP